MSAAKVQAIVRELAADRIEVKADGRTTVIASQDGDFRLFGDEPEGFPQLPAFEPLDFLEVGAPALACLIERVELAAARELGRYAVNGALLTWDGETITAVATDGRRLALAKHQIKAGRIPPRQAIVPLKGLAMFRKSLAGLGESVGLRLDASLVALRTPHADVTARVLEGEFPDFQEVLAQQHAQKAGVVREELLAAIRRAAVVLGTDSRAVKLSFHRGTLEVSAREEGSGEAKARIALEYQGPDQDVSVNPDFMLEFLKLPLTENIQVSFGRAETPVFWRPDEDYLYVVMPIEGP
ncbi:MAG: DNA polymerase III subunit beta [Planctomycetota bacterium]